MTGKRNFILNFALISKNVSNLAENLQITFAYMEQIRLSGKSLYAAPANKVVPIHTRNICNGSSDPKGGEIEKIYYETLEF